ncbi:MAG: NYN domain-containing protein [Candidatus Uhrbacteria bacterium]
MDNQKPKVFAFVDSQNLNLGVLDSGWKLDFKRFRVYLRDKFNVTDAFLFIGYFPGNEALYTFLQKAGFLLVIKPTLVINRNTENETVKGNVDAELVLHTMIEWKNYDKAIIVTGDGDFHCLLEYLESKKKLAHLIIPNKRKFSALLRKFRPYFVFLDGLEQKLSRKTKERE